MGKRLRIFRILVTDTFGLRWYWDSPARDEAEALREYHVFVSQSFRKPPVVDGVTDLGYYHSGKEHLFYWFQLVKDQ